MRGNGFFLLRAQRSKLVVDGANLIGKHAIANAHARARFVKNVDGLVRQEAILDVAIGKLHRGMKGFIGEAHMMMRLVAIS